MKITRRLLLVLAVGTAFVNCHEIGKVQAVGSLTGTLAKYALGLSSGNGTALHEAADAGRGTSLLSWWPGATVRKTWSPKASWLAAAAPEAGK